GRPARPSPRPPESGRDLRRGPGPRPAAAVDPGADHRRHRLGGDPDRHHHHRRDHQERRGVPPAVAGSGGAGRRADPGTATGGEAMVHAIEAYTSKLKKNPRSDMLAREALRLLAGNLDEAVHNGSNLQARQAMLLGSLLAGQAFANAPVAAVHALAYPLGGHFHIPHGLSNALVLPSVVAFNAPAAESLYAELAPLLV